MKLKKAFKIVLCLVLLAVIIIGAVVIYEYTNGLNEDFKTFYLRSGDEKIVSESTELKLFSDVDYRFDVVGTFGKLQGNVDFAVNVSPNDEVDFDYYVDGEKRTWQATKSNFTELFIKRDEKGFVLRSSAESFTEIMQRIYPNASRIELPSELNENIYPFAATVSAAKNSTKYIIRFSLLGSIALDKPSIVF